LKPPVGAGPQKRVSSSLDFIDDLSRAAARVARLLARNLHARKSQTPSLRRLLPHIKVKVEIIKALLCLLA
jgi:hypothetical protein